MWTGIALGFVGCDSEATPRASRAHFGSEFEIPVAGQSRVQDLAAATSDDDVWIAWSEDAGLFVEQREPSGGPKAERVRVGPGCPGGVAIAADEDSLVIACVVPGQPSFGRQGHITLWQSGDGVRWRPFQIATAGENSRGVTVDVSPARVSIAWLDLDAENSRAWFTEVERRDTEEGKPKLFRNPQPLSRPRLRGGIPNLIQTRHGTWATAGESVLDRNDAEVASVRLLENEEEHELAGLLVDDPMPVFERAIDPDAFVYRDENPAGSRVALFLERLQDGAPNGEPQRIGRADINEPAVFLRCATERWVVVLHRYGRRESVAAIHRLNASYETVGTERQIYEASKTFRHVAATCADSSVLVAVASDERGDPIRLSAVSRRVAGPAPPR